MNDSSFRHRLNQLDQLLCDSAHLWRPQPFKQRRPQWCEDYPQLTDWLLGLTESELQRLNDDPDRALQQLSEYLPALKDLAELIALPELPAQQYAAPENRFFNGMPGRKRSQIEAFVSRIGEVKSPLLEWCGGKGYLGRLLGRNWRKPVLTLEWNSTLCQAGQQQADRQSIAQQFQVTDVLAPHFSPSIAGHHAVALHACGELHRRLHQQVIAQRSPALDIVPCCYALGVEQQYQPRTEGLKLQLCRDDLRLAVTETVTAGKREVKQRDREMAWKLGYSEWRYTQPGETEYRTFKPVNKGWLQSGFSGFCHELAERDGLTLGDFDATGFEALGWQRQRDMMRLQVLRHGFRRALELWLVLDLSCDLERQGYQVSLGTFCPRDMTPRNIMISGRLSC